MQNDLVGGAGGAAPPDAAGGGPVDPSELQDPGGNLAAPAAAAQQPVQMQPAGKGIPSIDGFKEMHRKSALMDLALQKLLRQHGPISRRDIVDMAVKLVRDRLMSSAEMAKTLSDLPEEPFAIREWLQRHAMTVEQATNMMASIMHGSEQLRPLGEPEPEPQQPQATPQQPPPEESPATADTADIANQLLQQ